MSTREMTHEELKYAYMKKVQRVQELEKDIKEWEIVNECWEEINENLAEQNKRYREAINEIKHAWKITISYQEHIDVIQDIINELEQERLINQDQ